MISMVSTRLRIWGDFREAMLLPSAIPQNAREQTISHVCTPVRFRTAQVLHLSRTQVLMTVVIPGALPEIVSGLRIGFSVTLLGVLIGEMFASQRGVGYVIMSAIGLHDVPTIMAAMVLLAVVAVSASAFLLWLDHRLHHRAA
jgi:NitT/TauT family transport system permease protein